MKTIKKTNYKHGKQINFSLNIDDYFNKKYEFIAESNWTIPNNVYTADKWVVDEFQQKKYQLNLVKEQLSKYSLNEWSKHTKTRDPSSFILKTIRSTYQVELLTQAWCKFYECISQFNLIPKSIGETGSLFTVHLCEAPGAFICSLNHFLVTNYPNVEWKWLATTLNPNYEANPLLKMIPDDRLIQHTLDNWHFGDDLTGDLTKYNNHMSLIETIKSYKKAHLVTADGSIDCMMNPGDQECSVEYLHYCETMTALDLLDTGGTFLIKMFTMFEESTICLMYLLNCCFHKIHVYKPCTSKSGNSEVYVICLDFKGKQVVENIWPSLIKPYIAGKLDKSMFRLTDIDKKFLEQILNCCVFFMEKQIYTINNNITNFECRSTYELKKLTFIKNIVVDYFIKKCRLSSITNNKKIIKHLNISNSFYSYPQHKTVENWRINTLCKKLNVDDLIYYTQINFESLLDIKIGKYLQNIHYSKFCVLDNYEFSFEKKVYSELYATVLSCISRQNNVINICDFDVNLFSEVSTFQKLFFMCIKDKVQCNKNVIIIGIPLLTGFLVGLVFLLMLGFKHIWFINNIIVLEKPDNNKLNVLNHRIQIIMNIYRNLQYNLENNYVKDILQLVPLKHLQNNDFFECICRYNHNILNRN